LIASPVSPFARTVTEVRALRNSLTEEFACPKCSSQSVVYPTIPEDDEYVTCRGCGAVLATLGQFRRLVARRLMAAGTPVSGC
jgi:ribosomal protein S27E